MEHIQLLIHLNRLKIQFLPYNWR